MDTDGDEGEGGVMAYFSNGTEGREYQKRYCLRCVNYRDKEDGRGYGCVIWDVHLLFNGKEKYSPVLDVLIPRCGAAGNGACALFTEVVEVGK